LAVTGHPHTLPCKCIVRVARHPVCLYAMMTLRNWQATLTNPDPIVRAMRPGMAGMGCLISLRGLQSFATYAGALMFHVHATR
jgi:hypothetical protein